MIYKSNSLTLTERIPDIFPVYATQTLKKLCVPVSAGSGSLTVLWTQP